MHKSFPSTQDLKQSAHRQVKILIDRKNAYNMQVSKDSNTFRWSRTTLSGDSAAKLIRMKVRVFSEFTLCVGVSNRNEHGFVEQLDSAT